MKQYKEPTNQKILKDRIAIIAVILAASCCLLAFVLWTLAAILWWDRLAATGGVIFAFSVLTGIVAGFLWEN